MKYNRIDVYRDADNNFKYAVVDAEIGEIRVNDEKRFNNLLEEIKKLDDAVVVNEIVEKEDNVDKDDFDEIYYEIEADYQAKENKTIGRKTKKFVTRLVAGVSAIVILVTGAIHLNKHTNIFNGKKVNFGTNVEYNDPDKIVVSNNGETKTEFDKTMDKVIANQNKTSDVTNKLSKNDYNNLSSSEIMDALDNNWRLANSSIVEISNYLNGHSLKGNAYYSNFSNSFSDKEDQAVVEYFSGLRNSIVKSAYENKDINLVKTNVKNLYSNFVRFVLSDAKINLPINGKGKGITYSELSDMAKGIVLQIGMAGLTMPVDYKYYDEANDWSYSKMDILDAISKMYYEEIMPKINKSSSK